MKIYSSTVDWRGELNALENWFCSTGFWQRITRDHLLPWVLAGNSLGDHVLELGAGPGAGTATLQRLAPRVTSLEWSHDFAARLAATNRARCRARRRCTVAIRRRNFFVGSRRSNVASSPHADAQEECVSRSISRVAARRFLLRVRNRRQPVPSSDSHRQRFRSGRSRGYC